MADEGRSSPAPWAVRHILGRENRSPPILAQLEVIEIWPAWPAWLYRELNVAVETLAAGLRQRRAGASVKRRAAEGGGGVATAVQVRGRGARCEACVARRSGRVIAYWRGRSKGARPRSTGGEWRPGTTEGRGHQGRESARERTRPTARRRRTARQRSSKGAYRGGHPWYSWAG